MLYTVNRFHQHKHTLTEARVEVEKNLLPTTLGQQLLQDVCELLVGTWDGGRGGGVGEGGCLQQVRSNGTLHSAKKKNGVPPLCVVILFNLDFVQKSLHTFPPHT